MLLFFKHGIKRVGVLPWWLSGKESACQCRRLNFDPWVGKILWRRKWQPTPVFLPGKSHGPRSLVGYSPWGRKESDKTGRLHFLLHWLWLWLYRAFDSVVVVQSCLTLLNPLDCSTPGYPTLDHLLELAKTHVHWIGGAIQSHHPLTRVGHDWVTELNWLLHTQY